MSSFMKSIPITSDMVSLWVPSGTSRAQDLIRGNHGQCYGTHPNVPVISVPYSLNNCDAETDWTGTDLSIDTADKKEGTGCLVDTVAVPVGATSYTTTYNPAGTWNWSDKKHILFWLKSDRANTAFTWAKVQIVDTLSNYRFWNLTFSAGEWTAFKFLLSTGDGGSATPPDLALINYVIVQFNTVDTTPFYKKIDDLRIAYSPSLINPSVGWVFGGDDYIEVPNNKSLQIAGSFTIGALINTNAISEIKVIARKGFGATAGVYFLWLNTDYTISVYFYDDGGVGRSLTSTQVVNIGEWTWVVGVYDAGSQLRVYVNNVEKTVSQTATHPALTTENLFIGTRSSTLNRFDGYIALPFIANKAWSQAQIDNFYLHTKGMFAPRG